MPNEDANEIANFRIPKTYTPNDSEPTNRAHPSLLSDDLPQLAKNATLLAFFERCKSIPIDVRGTYVVWFVKTLTDWSAMTGTNVEDDLYYDVSYNGSTGFVTVHTYHKAHQKIVDGQAYNENGSKSFAHFAASHASSVYNFLNHPTQLPMQSDDWHTLFESRTFHNRKIVLKSMFTAYDMYEVTLDHGADKIYVDAYRLVGSSVYPISKVTF
jgi:hypothetical protein